MHVGHARPIAPAPNHVAHRMHQMRLAQSDAAIDEKRVVCTARILCDLNCRRTSQLVTFAFDEIGEGKIWIESASEDGWNILRGRAALERRSDDRCSRCTRAD